MLVSMPAFAGNPSDIADAIAYEAQAIDYLRAALHGQSEAPGDGMSLVLGDVNEEGMHRRTLYMRAQIGISDGAVRAALDRLRPLAFSAAFKIQDMVAEWILRAHGVTAWPFSRKLAEYDRLLAGGALVEPDLFSGAPFLARAFWELYRFFVPFRGTVVHAGGVTLDAGGTVVVTRDATTLRLSVVREPPTTRACADGLDLAGAACARRHASILSRSPSGFSGKNRSAPVTTGTHWSHGSTMLECCCWHRAACSTPARMTRCSRSPGTANPKSTA